MTWTWRPWRKHKTEQSRPTKDYGSAGGRHRLRDNDVVPINGYRRYAQILQDINTRELPAVNPDDRFRFTPGQEQRAGIRNWLA